MTLIIAHTNGKESFIAGDRCASDGFIKYLVTQPKVFSKHFNTYINNTITDDKILIGGTTSFRMLQLLEYGLILPDNKRDRFYDYLVLDLIPVLIDLFDKNWKEVQDNQKSPGGEFIILHNHKIYNVQKEFSVLESQNNFFAVGSGCYHATGALSVLDRMGIVNSNIANIFDIVSKNITSVSSEFDIIKY